MAQLSAALASPLLLRMLLLLCSVAASLRFARPPAAAMAGIDTVEEDEKEVQPCKADSHQRRRSSSAAMRSLPPLSPRRAACCLLRPAFGMTVVLLL